MSKRLPSLFFNVFVILVLLGFVAPVYAKKVIDRSTARFTEMNDAQENDAKVFYDREKEGWYWYVVLPDAPEEDKDPRRKPVPVYTYDRLWAMHPDDFKQHFDQVLKQAVQFPTENNMAHFLQVMDTARRKASAVASVAGLVSQKHPQFSTEDVYPITAPGRAALTGMQIREYEETIYNARSEFALIMFTRASCAFCEAQQSILRFFEQQYNWPVRMVDADAAPALAGQFGIEQAPSLILVHKGSQDYLPVSSGVISLSKLKKRLYRSIRYMQGKTTPEQWDLYEYERNSGHDPLKFVGTTSRK